MIVFLDGHVIFYCERQETEMATALEFKGRTYKNRDALVKELTRCAIEARKSYRHSAFNAKAWKMVDPSSYDKALEIKYMRRILGKLT